MMVLPGHYHYHTILTMSGTFPHGESFVPLRFIQYARMFLVLCLILGVTIRPLSSYLCVRVWVVVYLYNV